MMKKATNKKEYNIGQATEKVVKILNDTSWKKSFVFLNGPVGTGKTTAISYIFDELKIKFDQSPTYISIKEYHGENYKYRNVYHLDFYKSQEKFKESEKNQIILDSFENDGLYLIEWPNRFSIKEAIRQGNLIIWIEFIAFYRCNINVLINRYSPLKKSRDYVSSKRSGFRKRKDNSFKSYSKRKEGKNFRTYSKNKATISVKRNHSKLNQKKFRNSSSNIRPHLKKND